VGDDYGEDRAETAADTIEVNNAHPLGEIWCANQKKVPGKREIAGKGSRKYFRTTPRGHQGRGGKGTLMSRGNRDTKKKKQKRKRGKRRKRGSMNHSSREPRGRKKNLKEMGKKGRGARKV